jgi:hypothetical protein
VIDSCAARAICRSTEAAAGAEDAGSALLRLLRQPLFGRGRVGRARSR